MLLCKIQAKAIKHWHVQMTDGVIWLLAFTLQITSLLICTPTCHKYWVFSIV